MEDAVKRFLLFISHYKFLAYPVISLISFSESFFIIGLIVPGALIIGTCGFLASLKIFNFYYTIISCSIGAILGDIFSYHLATISGEKIKKSDFFKKYKEYYNAGVLFFKKYGGFSVFIGRFIGVFRPIIPFLAGLHKMDLKKFYFYAIISGILWGICYPGVGFIFGETWKKVEAKMGEYVIIGIILACAIYYCYIYIKKSVEKGRCSSCTKDCSSCSLYQKNGNKKINK